MTKLGYSYEEAGEQVGVSGATIRREVEAGNLIARRIGKRNVVISHEELTEWLLSRPAVD